MPCIRRCVTILGRLRTLFESDQRDRADDGSNVDYNPTANARAAALVTLLCASFTYAAPVGSTLVQDPDEKLAQDTQPARDARSFDHAHALLTEVLKHEKVAIQLTSSANILVNQAFARLDDATSLNSGVAEQPFDLGCW